MIVWVWVLTPAPFPPREYSRGDRVGRLARVGTGAEERGPRLGVDRLHRRGVTGEFGPGDDVVAVSSSSTASGKRPSIPTRPGRYSNGAKEFGKLQLENRGASIACCTSIPKWNAFRNTCNIACTRISPTGQPNASTEPSSRTASAGFGVSRGRFPGTTPQG